MEEREGRRGLRSEEVEEEEEEKKTTGASFSSPSINQSSHRKP